jgi:hypothetical protein
MIKLLLSDRSSFKGRTVRNLLKKEEKTRNSETETLNAIDLA